MLALERLASKIGPELARTEASTVAARRSAVSEVVFGDATGERPAKRCVPGHDREGPAESGVDVGAGGCRVLLEDVCVRVPAVPEQRHHLLLVDAITDRRRVFEAGEPAAEPHAGRLAALAVVLARLA